MAEASKMMTMDETTKALDGTQSMMGGLYAAQKQVDTQVSGGLNAFSGLDNVMRDPRAFNATQVQAGQATLTEVLGKQGQTLQELQTLYGKITIALMALHQNAMIGKQASGMQKLARRLPFMKNWADNQIRNDIAKADYGKLMKTLDNYMVGATEAMNNIELANRAAMQDIANTVRRISETLIKVAPLVEEAKRKVSLLDDQKKAIEAEKFGKTGAEYQNIENQITQVNEQLMTARMKLTELTTIESVLDQARPIVRLHLQAREGIIEAVNQIKTTLNAQRTAFYDVFKHTQSLQTTAEATKGAELVSDAMKQTLDAVTTLATQTQASVQATAAAMTNRPMLSKDRLEAEKQVSDEAFARWNDFLVELQETSKKSPHHGQ